MTAYVDPQHIEVIVARAHEELRQEGCGCVLVGIWPDDPRQEQCLAHLTIGLLQPTVTAYEPVF